ncbi:MAG: MerR family transcriptional regulator [Rikenellaceae bacterium]|nr:MerR family transcriptional regulator [Rikenellaceae bacterium]
MEKLLYSMGEVTEMFDVNASLIRYWESKFDCIRPHKNKKGNRMFTPSDIENFKLIYHLVKERGMTLEGANMAMKRRGKSVKREISILERLQNIRAMLIEVRESLGDNTPAAYEAPVEAMSELIADVESEAKAEVVASVTAPEEVAEQEQQTEQAAEVPQPRRRGRPRKVAAESVEGEEATMSVTRRRKAKKSEESKELFPFYEQSLF